MQYLYLIILLLSVGGSLLFVGRGRVRLAYGATGASIVFKTKALSQGTILTLGGCRYPSTIVPSCWFPHLDKQ